MPRPGWDRPERLRPGTAAWDSPPASYPSPSRHGRPSDSDLDTTQPRGSPSLRQKGGAQSPTKDRAGGGAKTKREIKKATKELEEVQRATLDLLQDIKRTKEEHRNMDKEADKLKKEVLQGDDEYQDLANTPSEAEALRLQVRAVQNNLNQLNASLAESECTKLQSLHDLEGLKHEVHTASKQKITADDALEQIATDANTVRYNKGKISKLLEYEVSKQAAQESQLRKLLEKHATNYHILHQLTDGNVSEGSGALGPGGKGPGGEGAGGKGAPPEDEAAAEPATDE